MIRPPSYDDMFDWNQKQQKQIHAYQEILVKAKNLIDIASLRMCDPYHGSDAWSRQLDEFKNEVKNFIGYY